MKRLAAGLALVTLAACQGTAPAPPRVGGVPETAATAPTAAPPLGPSRPAIVASHDARLAAQIETRLRDLDGRAYRGVSVLVWNGRVVLAGAVAKPMQRRRAEQVATTTPGIGGVANDLIMAEDRALEMFLPDTPREQAIRAHLGLTGTDAAIVRVVNGVAFLVGGSTGTDQAEALREDAGEVDGVKWVVAHLEY